MECHEIQIELSAYLDGELTDTEARLVADHAADCAECGRVLEQLMAAKSAFRDLKPAESSPELKNRVLAATTVSERPRRWQRRITWLAPAVAAAAAVAWMMLVPGGTPTTTLEIAGPGAGPEVYAHLAGGSFGVETGSHGDDQVFGLSEGSEQPLADHDAIGALPGSELY